MAMTVYSAYKANEASLGYPRDASFSCYLDSAERDFARSLAESIHSPSPVREASAPRLSTVGKSKPPRSELGVFEAKKYFTESLELETHKSSTPRRHNEGRNRQRNRRERRDDLSERKSSKSGRSTSTSTLKSPTPSLKSEASWNTQLGLLNLPKKTGVGLKIFQCKGSCFDKKSVHTASTHLTSQSPRYQGAGHRKTRLSNQDHFAFPIIDTASPRNFTKNKNLGLEQARKSLEVFGLHQIGKEDIAENLERKLSILAWDAIPNSTPNAPFSFPFPNSKIKASLAHQRYDNDHDQDARSDASSDLFEIEHLSGVSMGRATGQVSDVSSYMNPTNGTHCYEPSEASIEWSVVTATAAEFPAVYSDREDKYETKKISHESGLFLGCRNHKAVDVVRNNNHHHKIKNIQKVKYGTPDIALSTPSRRSSNYALAYS